MKKVAKFNLSTTKGLKLTVLTEQGVEEIIDKKIAKAIEELKNSNKVWKSKFGDIRLIKIEREKEYTQRIISPKRNIEVKEDEETY